MFRAQVAFGKDIPQSATDLIADPGLIDPSQANFAITAESIARDSGVNMTDAFLIDKHDADHPAGLADPLAITIRDQKWDRGPYEFVAQPSPTANRNRWWIVVVGLVATGFVLVEAIVVVIWTKRRPSV